MKKTIFNASFEESQNYVTEKYVTTSMEDSKSKVTNKRTLGIVLMASILLIMAFFIKWIEQEAPISKPMLASHINPIVYLAACVLPIYYVFKLIKCKNSKILNSYYFNQTMIFITFPMSISLTLFCIGIASAITNTPIVIYIYITIFIFFIVNRYLKMTKKITRVLYDSGENNNKILDYYNKFENFSKKYGFLVVIILFVINKIFGTDKEQSSNRSIIDQVLIILSPLIGFGIVAFIFAMIESVMEGYYVKKYCEEYRIKYGYSKKDWYGSKSKMYKEELKNK